jgi:Anti-sigma-K factor rskA
MSVPSLEELERQLGALPREAWDRPIPPPSPWPADPVRSARRRRLLPADPVRPARRRGLPPADPFRPARRRRLLVLRPVAVAFASLALLAIGLGAGLLLDGGGGESPGGPGTASLRVELQPVGDGSRGADGVVTLAGRAGGSATARLSGLRPSEGGDFYELWLLGDDGELVSLGSVRVPPSGRAELRVPLPVDPNRFRFLDVSREPADGDPSHSTDSVLRGPTT